MLPRIVTFQYKRHKIMLCKVGFKCKPFKPYKWYQIIFIYAVSLQVCLFFCITYLKSVPQFGHLYGFSPVCCLMCCLTLRMLVFLYLQCLHLMGSMSCLSICCLKFPSRLKELSHNSRVQEKCKFS